ncbi:MAG: hypothetical protein A3H88_03210 [Candidatus Blackburnbacteria bacterium RIFCSPLOWO2_02_FULL_44_9]|nr:MAG: hypothetical protein A3E16_00440 [Candidatus Blackburnbacteria bacterium RIFCSPHIGHO2_12_FULL_44_25]OGY16198.1 MAG: hypothetical protein A3H88_03210 [Candidatus Blackburnbacteria bacterium RIFCSPLOWO2_02_FULL_44_9]
MITKKLKTLIFIAIPVFFIHGMEEYFNNFYEIDPISRFAFQYFENFDSLRATFLFFQIMIVVLLITSFLLLLGGRYILFVAILFGLVFIFELHHLYRGITMMEYYPGLITSFFVYVLGYFYWKELLANLKRN